MRRRCKRSTSSLTRSVFRWRPSEDRAAGRPFDLRPVFTHAFYGDAIVFHRIGPRASDVIREIERLVDAGVGGLALNFSDMTTFTQFLDEVVPNIRLERRA